MAKYSREVVAEVLAAVDIEQLIRPSVELKSAGTGRLKGLCPFHTEKTPSFHVNRERQTFHCFGCGKGGDAVSFLMEHDGLTFIESLRKLADVGGVRLPAMSEGEDRNEFLRQQLQELGRFAATWFQEQLHDAMKGSGARGYLKKRQLREATIKRFGIGFAPEGWNNFGEAARKKGFKENVIEASGLLKRGERGSVYDFFRNRLMFPIREVSGQVVAFGGRDLGDGPAKYINSPETALYKKSHVLYGLHEARDAMRKSRQALLVEGYFDALRLFDAGIDNVVASCGTALTPEQARLIERYAREVVIVYDGDQAGINAAMKATGMLVATGLRVRAVCLPEGQDPDDFVLAHGAAAFLDAIENAPDFVSYYAQMSADRLNTIEGRSEVAQELFAIIAGLDDELRVDAYLKRTAQALGLNEQSARAEFNKYRRPEPGSGSRIERPAPVRNDRAPHPDDIEFLALLLQSENLAGLAREKLHETPLPQTPLGQVMARVLFDDHDHAHVFEDEAARKLFAAASAAPEAEAESEQARDLVEKRLVSLEREAMRAEMVRLQAAIEDAERVKKDKELATNLLIQKIQLNQQLERLGAA